MPNARSFRLWLVLPTSLVLLLAPLASAAVTIDWVTLGGAGNACDVQTEGCFGAVATSYRISKTEVTNAQYTEFLNEKAVSDPNGLYSTSMGSAAGFGGITRSGIPGSYTYTANCLSVVGNVIGVGRYTGSASPNGTFDQGGNVWEMNEAVILVTNRGNRGGSFITHTNNLAAFNRGAGDPSIGNLSVGFRVASSALDLAPVPSLSQLGIAILCTLLGLANIRTRHA